MGYVLILTEVECLSLLETLDFRFFEDKSVLVTGATGMLGSYLCSSLIMGARFQGVAPPNLTLLVRSAKSPNLEYLSQEPRVEIIQTELLDWVPDRIFDILIHAASPASPTKYGDSKSVLYSNSGWLERVAGARMPRATLFVSSGEVYGPNAPKGVEEEFIGTEIPDSPRAVYPIAKLAGESTLLKLFNDGLTLGYIARLFHTFGPGLRPDDGRSFSDFLWAAANKSAIRLRSSGDDVRTFLYVLDAISGLLTVLVKGVPGDIYNVGSDAPVSILDFAKEVGRIGGVKVHLGDTKADQNSNYLHSPNKSIIPSNKKLALLGWREAISMDVGISTSLEFMRARIAQVRK